MKGKDRKKSSTKIKAGGRMARPNPMARPTPMAPARARAERTKRERERAMEILQEETGTAGTQSEIDRVMKALREKKLK